MHFLGLFLVYYIYNTAFIKLQYIYSRFVKAGSYRSELLAAIL